MTTTYADFGPSRPATLDGEPAKGVKAAVLSEAAALRERLRQADETVRACVGPVAQAMEDYGNAYPTPEELDANVDTIARVMRNAYPMASDDELQQHVGRMLVEQRTELLGKAQAVRGAVEAARAVLDEARLPGPPVEDFAARTYYQQQLRHRFAGKNPGEIAAGLRTLTDELGTDDPLIREAASRDGRAVLESMGAERVTDHVKASSGPAVEAGALVGNLTFNTVGLEHDAKHAYRGDRTTRAGAALNAVGVARDVEPDLYGRSTGSAGVTWFDAS